MEAKDKWVETILDSSNGIKQVIPNEALLDKIRSRINAEQPIPTLTKWMIAASIAILISLNVAMASRETDTNNTTNSISSLVDTEGNQIY